MRCRTHQRNFSYTCSICEEEYLYANRTNLLTFFRADVLGKEIPMNGVQEQAAYEHGKTFSKKSYERNEA